MVCLRYIISISPFCDNHSLRLCRDFRVDLGNRADILISAYRYVLNREREEVHGVLASRVMYVPDPAMAIRAG